MPTITVNAEPRSFPDPLTVSDLLRALAKDSTKLAVEVNRDVVPRAEHPRRQLREGDAVEIVTLVGFGSFYVGKRNPRMGRNPRTNETIKIKGGKVPKFRAGKALKDALN